MSDEYEFYQGVVLRQLIVGAELSLIMRPFVKEGRINAFVINGKVGVFIKHSAKRMSPWRFTFTLEQVSDLLDLEAVCFDSFVVFVCGDDGLVTLDVGSLHQIVSFDESEHAWVRVDRKPRAQYDVSGNRAELGHKIANGTTLIHQRLLNAIRERRAS
ncbi:MAG TPA: hypothetical protein VKX28_07350 [Xanthobacteraceae bacterium]|nr:hypothetical protein [Xanthobacteraceae bacterium]